MLDRDLKLLFSKYSLGSSPKRCSRFRNGSKENLSFEVSRLIGLIAVIVGVNGDGDDGDANEVLREKVEII